MVRTRPLWAAPAILYVLLAAGPATATVPFDHFEPDAADHSWINTSLLATASSWAYRVDVEQFEGDAWIDKFRFVYHRLGLEVLAFLSSGEQAEADTQALVLGDGSIVVVAFSGTATHERKATLRDVKTDARIRQLEVDAGDAGRVRIHRGFHLALDAVWEELEATVAAPLEEGRTLWLTGHSLGGALANLAAWRWHRAGIPVAGVVTFAAPKLGDAAFAADFEQRLGRRSQQWSTALDPTPRLPEKAKGEAYVKLGVTHVVHASGVAELDTEQRMTSVPNPLAHRTSAYLNYLYRALPEEVRDRVPPPPPLCAASSKMVGLHPEDDYPICLGYGRRKIRQADCRERGGEIFERWCLSEVAGKFRYRAQKLKRRKN